MKRDMPGSDVIRWRLEKAPCFCDRDPELLCHRCRGLVDIQDPTLADEEAATRLAWESWRCLDLLADTGDIESLDRHGWEILVRVHGFDAVLRAVASCYWLVAPTGKVTCDQAKDVLDGKSAIGPPAASVRHAAETGLDPQDGGVTVTPGNNE